MEIIYPRNTRNDNDVVPTVGVVGDGGIVENQSINQTFYEWLTQHFNEDNSRTIIETINHNCATMPDVGVNELLIAYMQKFETELTNIKEAVHNVDLSQKLIENHSVIDLGAFTWNGFTEHIYMLAGGVPATITLNQYINNICVVALFGSEFKILDAATGLVNLSLYPAGYIETLLNGNVVFEIGIEKYVPITICEITINNNELGNQLEIPVETEVATNVVALDSFFGFHYNYSVVTDAKGIANNGWRIPLYADAMTIWLYDIDSTPYKSKLEKYWSGSANNYGTDEYGLNHVASGRRTDGGVFELRGIYSYFWLGDQPTSRCVYFTNSIEYAMGFSDYAEGYPIRLVKDAPGVADGTIIEYTGNNGRVYTGVAFNEFYILNEDLKETMFNDLSVIPVVTDTAAWAALRDSSAMCNYDNEPLVESSNGGIVVSDGNEISLIPVDSGGGFKPPLKFSEFDGTFLTSVMLRKIGG